MEGDAQLNELHLFAGAGGGILGGMLLGHTCVCAVEIEPYCRKVLLQRQRDGILPRFPIWDDVRTFDGKPWRGLVDVVCGGFPCQDISVAGKGKGIEGERSGLWAEFARIIGEVQPRYIFVENSPLLTKRGLGRVLGDLSEMGYDAEWCVLGADDIGAPHQRKRMWILAYARLWGRRYNIGEEDGEISIEGDSGKRSCNTNSSLRPSEGAEIMADAKGEQDVGRNGRSMAEKKGGGESCHTPACACRENVSDTASQRAGKLCYESGPQGTQMRNVVFGEQYRLSGQSCSWWLRDPADGDGAFESGMGRVAHGVAHRVDRLKANGNGQVPLVAATAWPMLIKRLKGDVK